MTCVAWSTGWAAVTKIRRVANHHVELAEITPHSRIATGKNP
jgi:hypothetical protein